MLKIGFSGCGWINQTHMGYLSKLDGVALAAFHDLEEAKSKAAAERYGGRAYSDGERMLEEADLDALYIAVPPAAHGIEITAARKGIHLFIEKPAAVCMETAREISTAIEKAGVICSVGYHFRYMEASRRAKELLAGRKAGMALGCWIGGMPTVDWWRRKALSGGQAVEQTTHIFDLARWLAGEIEEVSAYHATRALQEVPGFDVWDVGAVNLKFENGAIGAIHSTCLIEQDFRLGLDVICKDFALQLEGNRLRLSQPSGKEEIVFQNDPYLEEDRVFVEAVKSGRRDGILSPYDDAVKTLAVTLAANRSAEEGRPVKVEEMFAR
jgi:predicted dehydrogenase